MTLTALLPTIFSTRAVMTSSQKFVGKKFTPIRIVQVRHEHVNVLVFPRGGYTIFLLPSSRLSFRATGLFDAAFSSSLSYSFCSTTTYFLLLITNVFIGQKLDDYAAKLHVKLLIFNMAPLRSTEGDRLSLRLTCRSFF